MAIPPMGGGSSAIRQIDTGPDLVVQIAAVWPCAPVYADAGSMPAVCRIFAAFWRQECLSWSLRRAS